MKMMFLHQGTRSIEDYIVDFLELAHMTHLDEICLLIFFQGGLSEPLSSIMPLHGPNWTFENYIDMAIQLSGSLFTVGIADEENNSPVVTSTPEPCHKMASNPETGHKMAANTETLCKLATIPMTFHKMATSPEMFHKMAATSESSPVMAADPESRTIMTVVPEAAHVMPAKPEPTHVTPAKPEPTHVTPAKSEPAHVTLAKPEPAHVTPAKPEPAHVPPTKPEPAHVTPAKPEPAHVSADLPESRHVVADRPESRHIIAVIPSHADLSHPNHVDSIFLGGTVSTFSGLPAATHSNSPGTAPLVSEIDNVFSVLPVMATAILCVWATHTVVPPEVSASTAEPSEVVVPTLLPESVPETTSAFPQCPVLFKEAFPELSIHIILAKETSL